MLPPSSMCATAERYSGENEPVDPVAGHIPGSHQRAVVGECCTPTDDSYHPAEIARLVRRGRLAASRQCGAVLRVRDHRRAQLLALESAGLTAAIYPGSWSDWIPTRAGLLPPESSPELTRPL